MRASTALHSLTSAPQIEHCGIRLHSAFQPIISVAHSKVVGHEALVRGHSAEQQPMHPAELFPRLKESYSPEQVHEICTRLHLNTFTHFAHEGWLFLNVNPESIVDRKHVRDNFENWLRESGLDATRVVVEIIETRACNSRKLTESVQGFRDLGCLVAIDDFGAGESNFERVWRLQPDIVKLDRAMITEAATNPLVHRILPGIVSLVHEAGCLVVMEGIETELQAMIAVESDVDFVQGYFFSKPGVYLGDEIQMSGLFEDLAIRIKTSEAERSAHTRSYITSFIERFHAAVDAMLLGDPIDQACQDFVEREGVQRVYQLNDEGCQVGHNIESSHHDRLDERYLPCADGRGANWYRRPYFQRAVAAPGRIQVSRPYLSVTDAQSCVTISIAISVQGSTRVVCADIDHLASQLNHDSGSRYSTIVRR